MNAAADLLTEAASKTFSTHAGSLLRLAELLSAAGTQVRRLSKALQ
jgi:hypothetical protein